MEGDHRTQPSWPTSLVQHNTSCLTLFEKGKTSPGGIQFHRLESRNRSSSIWTSTWLKDADASNQEKVQQTSPLQASLATFSHLKQGLSKRIHPKRIKQAVSLWCLYTEFQRYGSIFSSLSFHQPAMPLVWPVLYTAVTPLTAAWKGSKHLTKFCKLILAFQIARKAGHNTASFLGLQQHNSLRSTAANKRQSTWHAKTGLTTDSSDERRAGTASSYFK